MKTLASHSPDDYYARLAKIEAVAKKLADLKNDLKKFEEKISKGKNGK